MAPSSLRKARTGEDCQTFLEWQRLREYQPTRCAHRMPFRILSSVVDAKANIEMTAASNTVELIAEDVCRTSFLLECYGNQESWNKMLEMLVDFSTTFVLDRHFGQNRLIEGSNVFLARSSRRLLILFTGKLTSVLHNLFTENSGTAFEKHCQIVFLQTLREINKERAMKRPSSLIYNKHQSMWQCRIKRLSTAILESYFGLDVRVKLEAKRTLEVLMRLADYHFHTDHAITSQQIHLFRDLCDNLKFLQSDTPFHIVISQPDFVSSLIDGIYCVTLLSLRKSDAGEHLRQDDMSEFVIPSTLIAEELTKLRNLWFIALICRCPHCERFLASAIYSGLCRLLTALVYRLTVIDDDRMKSYFAPLHEIIRTLSYVDKNLRCWYCLYSHRELVELISMGKKIESEDLKVTIDEMKVAMTTINLASRVNRDSISYLLAPEHRHLRIPDISAIQEKGIPMLVLSSKTITSNPSVNDLRLLKLRTFLTEVIQQKTLDRLLFESKDLLTAKSSQTEDSCESLF